MDKERETKRLFLGMECSAPWPETFPKGRIIQEKDRHATLAFLGNIEIETFERHLESFPKPPFSIGFAGFFSHCLFLPPKKPRVVAWEVDVQNRKEELIAYHEKIKMWLLEGGYHVDNRPYLPHVTVSRGHFQPKHWEKFFSALPCVLKDIHLYESLGSSQYQKIWTYPLEAPFTEFEHTADIAFVVRGKDADEVFHHAAAALAFEFPELLKYGNDEAPTNLNEIVMGLNRIVGRCDADIGAPIKAVSYHGELKEKKGCLEWEMIVDV